MNIANKITLFRVFLVPLFLIVLYSNIENNTIIAGIIFVIASLTDMLDGYIARSQNLVTSFGKFVDPLADKVLASAALIALVDMGEISGWIVVIIIAREFTVTGFRVLAASQGVTIAASPWGKIKTITQLVAIILFLFNNFPFSLMEIKANVIMIYIALIFTIVSGIDYIVKNKNIIDIKDI